MSHSDSGQKPGPTIARVKTHGGLEMGDCQIRLASEIPEHAAVIPAFSKTWIEGERPVHQPKRSINILAKKTEHEGGFAKDVGVVVGDLDGVPGEIEALQTTSLSCPTVRREEVMTLRRQGKGGAVLRIAFDR